MSSIYRSISISAYDYEHRNASDDFLIALAEKLVQAEVLIFATPVYWYSMSAQMKTFFDRLSDLVSIRKDLGRALKGKQGYLVTSSSENALPPGFEIPFIYSFAYLDMEWGGSFHACFKKDGVLSDEVLHEASAFGKQGLLR